MVQLANSRVRYETSYGSIKSTELYHYKNGAIYTICDTCSAILFSASPDKWWGETSAGDQCTQMERVGNSNSEYWFKCTRASVSSYGVIELEVRGKVTSNYHGTTTTLYKPGESNFDIRYVKFQDGRELQLSGYQKMNNDANKFEIPSSPKCPEPQCKSFADIVFVLDTSSSVDNTEWDKTKSFLKKAVSKFSYEEGGAMVGMIEFNAPDKTCCGGSGWWNCCCNGQGLKTVSVKPLVGRNYVTRYIDDCLFDQKCNNKTDNTANVLFELTNDRVIDKVNNLKRSSGHTCQRYGLQLAYKMLYENNPRCKDGLCPVPIVIVVTDGEDLCHTSTEEWAKILREKDDRGYLLEVGVGLEAQFDIDYIANLSSTIGGNKATLSVDNFNEIDKALDTIIKPVCEIGDLGASCGPECHGFCACGQCACPVCDEGADVCNYFECNTEYPDNGCVAREESCIDEVVADTQCYEQWCDKTEQDPSKKCKAQKLDCTDILKKQGHTLANCQYVDCVNHTGGCDIDNVINDHEFCQNKAQKCYVGKCMPGAEGATPDGCVFEPLDCSYMKDFCTGEVRCDHNGECKGQDCDPICTRGGKPFCPDQPCQVTHCNNSEELEDTIAARCSYTPFECKQESSNNCKEYVCKYNGKENTCEEVSSDEKLKCSEKSTGCVSYSCVASADNGKGACVGVKKTHETDVCTNWTCDPETGLWNSTPKCTTELACKTAKCSIAGGGVCSLVDVNCYGKVENLTDCFQAICKEPKGCQKKLYDGAYVDICGECIRPDGLESGSVTESQETGCIDAPEEPLDTEGLAAAAIALIILGAIIIGAAVAASTVLGTKALLDRARGAANQSVVSNPLFEDSATEMSNPAFAGDTV
jgi:von Willebrand factor type A domain.